MEPVKNVDEYIAQAPEEVQEKLKELRAVIRNAAPDAEESISYGMPYYTYKGRLLHFRHWKKHIGIYIPTPVVEEHQSELQGYETTDATIRFPLNETLPLALIEKLVQARVRKNDEAEEKHDLKGVQAKKFFNAHLLPILLRWLCLILGLFPHESPHKPIQFPHYFLISS